MSTREVHHGDGVQWLREASLGPEHAIVTSLPDVSELPSMGLERWRQWFVEVVALACHRVAPSAVAVFYQTDIKYDGRWIDKAHLVHCGADEAAVHCLWHKIVCRTAAGQITFGRPAYGHWMAFSSTLRLPAAASSADVRPAPGSMTWARAMPMVAAVATCQFLLDRTGCRVVVDPFCGHGTMLAVANAHGMDAIGVERSAKRVRKSRRATWSGPKSSESSRQAP